MKEPSQHPLWGKAKAAKENLIPKKPYSLLQIIRYISLLGFFVFFIAYGLSGFALFPPLTAALIAATVLGGSFFCGWICPMGLMQDGAGWIARRLGIRQKNLLPRMIHLALIPLRLILFACVVHGLAVTGYYLLFADARRAVHSFIAADIPHLIACAILLFFVVLSVFYKRVFCSYFCVEGIKQSLIGPARLLTIVRNPESCINCKQCDTACPMGINVSLSANVQSLQCVNCFQCVTACPVKKTLSFGPLRPEYDPLGQRISKTSPLSRYGVWALRMGAAAAVFAFWVLGPGKVTAAPHIGKSASYNTPLTGASSEAQTGASGAEAQTGASAPGGEAGTAAPAEETNSAEAATGASAKPQ